MGDRKQTIVGNIESARGSLVDLVQSLDAESLGKPTCNEGWCVKDVIAHLAAAETGLRNIANRAAKGESGARPGFDLHAHNKEQVELRRGRTVDELLAEMADSRVATLSFLEALPVDYLDKPGQLSSGLQLTVEGILNRIAEHEREHAEDIRKAISG